MNISASGEWDKVRAYEGDRKMDSVVAVAVDTSYPINDQFYEARMSYGENVPFLKAALRCMFIFGILFLVSVVWTAMAAGRKPEDEEIHLNSFDRWYTEIAAGAVIGIWTGRNDHIRNFDSQLIIGLQSCGSDSDCYLSHMWNLYNGMVSDRISQPGKKNKSRNLMEKQSD